MQTSAVKTRPKLKHFAHASVPCRDLEEGKRFYGDVLGGELHVSEPAFAAFRFGDVDVGIGSEGCNFTTERDAEYPHIAFYVDADTLVAMRDWLTQCQIPVSNLWTRFGKEVLMFFRDPSGNVIELFCVEGYAGADKLPRGPARGHGSAVDINTLRYNEWRMP